MHACIHITITISNIKVDQIKHTPGKRENGPYLKPPDQTKVIKAGKMSEFKSH